jgi:hypothetical protein
MDNSQTRVRPGFLLGLFVFFAFFGWLVLSGVPTAKDKQKAQQILTRGEERIMAELLQENAFKFGGLTNISTGFLLDSFQSTDKFVYSFARRTNAAGEPVDIWQTPYRIGLLNPTNFIIHSAGKNQKFGDADDIVFNGASNAFVNP